MPHSRIQRYFRHGRLSHLAAFEASARLGSYTRAARELHLAQPTISAQIKKLTEALGVPIFEAVGGQMHPTAAGRCVQEACADVVAAFARLEHNLARLRMLEAGSLTLAAGSAAARVASRLVASFAREHPRLEVSLRIHNRRTLLERMGRDEDDLYLFANPSRTGIVSQRVAALSLHVMAADDHPLAARSALTLEALAEEPFILRERGSGTREAADAFFGERGFVPRVRLELPSNEAVEEAVRAGAGLALLPAPADAHGLARLDVAGLPVERHLYLAYRLGRAPGFAARAFLEFARREAAVQSSAAATSAASAAPRPAGTP